MASTISSYIPTSGGTDTRTRDQLSFPFNARPQALTAYIWFIELGTIAELNTGRIFQISDSNGANPYIRCVEAGGFYEFRHRTPTSQVVATLAAASAVGDIVELRCVLNADGSVEIGQSLNGAAETTAGPSSALTLDTAWSEGTLHVNSTGTTNFGFNAFMNIVFFRGVHSLARMRRFAGVKQ